MIGYFHGLGHILPADFTQELSEYEILCKLLEKVSELDKKVEVVAEDAKNYTNTKFNTAMESISNLQTLLQKEISDLEESLTQQIENAQESAISTSKIYTDEKVQNMRVYLMAMIDIIKTSLAQSLVDLENRVKELDEAQRLWVLSEINKMWVKIEALGKNVIVKDPLTGQLNNIQDVINKIWGLTNRGGITCGEYDAVGLTCGEYDDIGLTCYQYDTQARERLMKDYRFIVFQPVSGKQVNYKQVLSWLTSLHQEECLTCEEYDNKELTCEEYDSLSLTAEQYDWDSVTMVKLPDTD